MWGSGLAISGLAPGHTIYQYWILLHSTTAHSTGLAAISLLQGELSTSLIYYRNLGTSHHSEVMCKLPQTTQLIFKMSCRNIFYSPVLKPGDTSTRQETGKDAVYSDLISMLPKYNQVEPSCQSLLESGMMVHTYKHSSWDAAAGGLWIWGQLKLILSSTTQELRQIQEFKAWQHSKTLSLKKPKMKTWCSKRRDGLSAFSLLKYFLYSC
jgi:hypothetical protein